MTDDRAAYISGLRKLAALLEANPDLPRPYDGSNSMSPISFYVLSHQGDERSTIAALARAFPGETKKSYETDYFRLDGMIDGLHVSAVAYRDAVCERRVVGTREVTEEVLDPAALAAVPRTTVTKTVEDIEWVCAPLLAAEQARVVTA